MNIFVTGGTGFIGGHLVERLSQTDHQVCCLVRDPGRAGRLRELGVILVEGDVTDKASVLEGMRGSDWVFNLANIYTFWLPDKRAYHEINVEGTRKVLECALELGVSKVIHVSTYAIWAKCADAPFNEESPISQVQLSEYSRTKLAGDRIAWEFYEKRGLPLVMIHPGNVLGPGDNKPTGQFISDAVNGRMPMISFLNTVLTYVDVRDVAEVILKAAEKKDNLGQRYIAAGEQISMREMMKMTGEISGVPMPRLVIPESMAKLAAVLLTALARVTKKPPMMGLSVDQARLMAISLRADGSKAVRELGITYAPVSVAMKEFVPSCLAKTN